MITIKEDLAYRKNYSNKRELSQIKYIVIHYTANDGDTDENNGNYFDDKYIGASAHYFVDSDSATRSVPDDYTAYHCGGGRQGSTGGSYLGKCTNTNSIGIEICDDVKNGVIYPSDKTIENVIELTEYLMKKYDVPKSRVIRHYDVTGKKCPAYWCGTDNKNKKWKTEFWNKLGVEKKEDTKKDTSSKATTTKTTITKKAYSGTFPTLPKKGYLGKGDKGTQVGRLQMFLNWYGNYGLVVDKDFGAKTKTAVEKFQKATGLTVDGYFGSKSLAKAKTIKK